MSIYDEITKKHFSDAGEAEKMYLMKEPTGKTANQLLDILSGLGLSAIQIKGCLEHAKYLIDFRAILPTQK